MVWPQQGTVDLQHQMTNIQHNTSAIHTKVKANLARDSWMHELTMLWSTRSRMSVCMYGVCLALLLDLHNDTHKVIYLIQGSNMALGLPLILHQEGPSFSLQHVPFCSFSNYEIKSGIISSLLLIMKGYSILYRARVV